MNQVNQLTGKTDAEVLDGIRDGSVHQKSVLVAQQGLSPQDISWHMPQPGFMVGALVSLPEESSEQSD